MDSLKDELPVGKAECPILARDASLTNCTLLSGDHSFAFLLSRVAFRKASSVLDDTERVSWLQLLPMLWREMPDRQHHDMTQLSEWNHRVDVERSLEFHVRLLAISIRSLSHPFGTADG